MPSGRRPDGSRISVKYRPTNARHSSPSGTLMTKIQCQLSSTSRPPSGGPIAAPTPPSAAHAPMTAERRSRREAGEDEPQRRRRDRRRSGRLDDARRDEQLGRRCECAQRGAEGEDREPGAEHAQPADEVAELAERHEQRGEDDRVRAEDPREPGDGRLREVLADGAGNAMLTMKRSRLDDEDRDGDEREPAPRRSAATWTRNLDE